MPVDRDDLAALERSLDGGRAWGFEVETGFRVLAGTFELVAGRPPLGDAADRRLQVLFHPVAEVMASLRRASDDGPVEVYTFTIEQLADVVDRLEGPQLHAPLFDLAGAPGEWAVRPSLEGRSQTADGRAHTVTVALEAADGWRFDLHATFDDVRLRDATGSDLPLERLR